MALTTRNQESEDYTKRVRQRQLDEQKEIVEKRIEPVLSLITDETRTEINLNKLATTLTEMQTLIDDLVRWKNDL
jgi:predicted GTPase